ncbi:OmpA family protein [Nocardiopsis dassonvillei]|uniref:OmpA family protein n=1 Tax=Nocardiopsis dassonvillei TaxID=2014 RepID=UPI00200FA73C|nr:OmpA family protein [Nocardiopsis dassonvillei]MCK9868132.1 OmpA family protein [Nocardiopsis dassonvillei]
MHHPVRKALACAITLALLIAPPVLLQRWQWPAQLDGMSWDHLWLTLISATPPTMVLQALTLVLLWTLWGTFAGLVLLDTAALLRGQVPSIGLLRLAVTGVAGTSVAVSVPAVASVALADSALTTGEQDARGEEPAHTLGRTRMLAGFGTDSAQLTPTMTEELLPTVELLQLFGDPGKPVTVTGHTDTNGPDAYNRALSERRAESVAAFLAERLGEGWTITTEGAGSEQPRNHPDLGQAADRRAEIAYTLTTQPRAAADSPAEQSEREPSPPPEQEQERGRESSEHESRDSESRGRESEAADDLADSALTSGEGEDAGFSGTSMLVGAAAGAVVGAVGGRLTAPRRRGVRRGEADPLAGGESAEPEPEPEEVSGVEVLRSAGTELVSAGGYLRVADDLAVSARDGLSVTGTHGAEVCASVISRALEDEHTTVITTQDVLARAGAPEGVDAPGLVVCPDTASAITETELAYISAVRLEDEEEAADAPSWTLLVVKPPAEGWVSDRLDMVTRGSTDSGTVVLVLGEGWSSPTVRCDALDTVEVTDADGAGTTVYDGLHLLHMDAAAFSVCLGTDTEGLPVAEEVEEEEEEEDVSCSPAVEESELSEEGEEPVKPRLRLCLFGPQPRILLDDADVGARMRGATRRMLALLALHPDGMGTEALTEALFSHSSESKARGLRNTASSDARRVIREALGDGEAEILEVTSGRYRILREAVEVDVWCFDAALRAASATRDADQRLAYLRIAAAEYTHELLSEVELPWIEEKRQAYRRAAADCFVSLAKASEGPEQALVWLERARESDDLNEAVYQEIMRTQAALGRLDAVERAYQALSERLKAMRARPSVTTSRLFQELLGR